MTKPLKRISFERKSDGTWYCVREREESGESCAAMSLEECFAFVRAHDEPEQLSFANLAEVSDELANASVGEKA